MMNKYGIIILWVLLYGCSTGASVIENSTKKYNEQQNELMKAQEESDRDGNYLNGNIAVDKQRSSNDSEMLEKWKNL